MEILKFEFMRRAFIVGILLSIIIPLIGTVMVNKKNSMMGDALSHVSLSGVAIGLILGLNPVIGAIVICCFAALSLEVFRNFFPKGSDLATAVIMSAGIGFASVLSDFIPGVANFDSFLFGSIVAISDFEFICIILISVSVIIMSLFTYKVLIYMYFDKLGAKLAKMPIKSVNFIFTLATAFTVSIASRTVGVLMISSLMVIPVACSVRIGKSYFQTTVFSIIFANIFTVLGLMFSFYYGLKPGGSIVIIGVAFLIFEIIGEKIFKIFN